MSLVSEQERKNLAAVGASRAAAMLASIAYGEDDAQDDDSGSPRPQLVGVAIPPQQGDVVKRINVSDFVSGQHSQQLRTEKVANMGDTGHSYTLNSIRGTDQFLSYVMHKDNIGKVRVLYKPLVCKALICHNSPVVDHSLKMTRFSRSDTDRGAVVASLDTTGLLVITSFVTPCASQDQELQVGQKLAQRAVAKVQFSDSCMPDAAAKAAQGLPVGLVEVGVGVVYVALGNKLLCIDIDKAVQVQEDLVSVSVASLPSAVTQLAEAAGDFTALTVHPCGHEVAAGTTTGSVHVVPAATPLPSTVFEPVCEAEASGGTPQPRPVIQLAYLSTAPLSEHGGESGAALGRTVLVSAVAEPSGSLQLSTWAVTLSPETSYLDNSETPQVTPVDTLDMHAPEVVSQGPPTCSGSGWLARAHPEGWSQGSSGAVIATHTGEERGLLYAITVSQHGKLVRWVQCSIGTPVANFAVGRAGEVTEVSPMEATESVMNNGSGEAGGHQLLGLALRLGDGVATATIPCSPLTPPTPPSAVPASSQGEDTDDVAPADTQPEDTAMLEEVGVPEGEASEYANLLPTAEVPEAHQEQPAIVAEVIASVPTTPRATNTATAQPPVATTEPAEDVPALTQPDAQISGTHTANPDISPSPPCDPQPEAPLASAAAAPVATAVKEESVLSSLLQAAARQEAQAAAAVAAAVATGEPASSIAVPRDADPVEVWAPFQSGPVRPCTQGFNASAEDSVPMNGAPDPSATIAAAVMSASTRAPDPVAAQIAASLHANSVQIPVAIAPPAAAVATTAAPLLPEDLFGPSFAGTHGTSKFPLTEQPPAQPEASALNALLATQVPPVAAGGHPPPHQHPSSNLDDAGSEAGRGGGVPLARSPRRETGDSAVRGVNPT